MTPFFGTGGKLLGGLALSACVVAAGAVLLGLSVIVLPAYGGFKLHKFRQQRKRMKAFRKRTQARQQNPFVGRSVSCGKSELTIFVHEIIG